MAPNTIDTPNLRLRPLTSNDREPVISLRTNPLVYYWRETPDTPEEAFTWLEERLKEPLALVYAVELKPLAPDESEAGEPIVIGLTGAHHLPEVGYIFKPEYWGKGYATEALKAWLDMYWKTYPDGHPALEGAQGNLQGVPYLRAETGPEGKSSARVLQKCGFHFLEQRGVEKAEEKKKGTVVVHCWKADRPVQG